MDRTKYCDQKRRRRARVIARLTRALLRSALLRLRERFVTIPMSSVTNEYAFSFANEGWHYFRDMLAAHQRDAKVPCEDSGFFRFFSHPRLREVRYVTDVLFLSSPAQRELTSSCQLFFGTYPWGEWSAQDDVTGGVPYGHYYDQLHGTNTRDLDGYRRNPWYQPGDAYPLKIEWEQTIEVLESLRRFGYAPVRHGTWPEVVLLQRRAGDIRAVVVQGQHRVSALSHLGYLDFRAMITRDSMRVIRETDVQRWHHVRNGRCTIEQALMIFNAFFDLNGRERAQSLGLPASY